MAPKRNNANGSNQPPAKKTRSSIKNSKDKHVVEAIIHAPQVTNLPSTSRDSTTTDHNAPSEDDHNTDQQDYDDINYISEQSDQTSDEDIAPTHQTHFDTEERLDRLENVMTVVQESLVTLMQEIKSQQNQRDTHTLPQAVGRNDGNATVTASGQQATGEFEALARSSADDTCPLLYSGGVRAGTAVPERLKTKIWNHKFVELFDLLYPEKEGSYSLLMNTKKYPRTKFCSQTQATTVKYRMGRGF